MKASRLAQYGSSGVLGVTFVVLVVMLSPIKDVLPEQVLVVLEDILDAPSADVTEADFIPALVQWGTVTHNYTGYGAPGLTLKVETPGTVLNWTVMGWANQTSPSALKVCNKDTVEYGPYDWVFQADGSGNSGRGTFVSTPSSVAQRLSPDGNQCLLRVGAGGVWHVVVCVEGKPGGPRGIYDDSEGRRHLDTWDRCIEQDFRVKFP